MDLFNRQLQSRDVKAFQKFFKVNYADLVRYANNYLFDLAASKDIVQESFVYIWENAEALDIKSTTLGYLKTMVRNKCLNYLKRIQITDSLEILDFNAQLSAELQEDVETQETQADVFQDLLKAIEELPMEMRKVVELKYFEKYKYLEIASELGISVNTVKTQLKRAKAKINKALFLFLM